MINPQNAHRETLFSSREIAEKLFPREGEMHPDDLKAPLNEPEIPMAYQNPQEEEMEESGYEGEQSYEEDHYGEPEEPSTRKTRRSSERSRIKKKEAESRARDLERQLEEARQKLVVEREESLNKSRLLLEKEKTELGYYEDLAKHRFAKALETGDGRTAADIQSDLNSISQARTRLDEYENYMDSYREEAPVQSQSQQGDVPDEISQNYHEWLHENSWYNSNQQMQSLADQVYNQLDAQLRLSNREDLIGSPEFFNAITESVREHYGIGGQQQGAQAPQPQGSRPHYTGVSRQSGASRPGSAQGSGKYTLPQDVYEFARNLPEKRKPDGSFMSRQEVIDDFSRDYFAYQSSQQQNTRGR